MRFHIQVDFYRFGSKLSKHTTHRTRRYKIPSSTSSINTTYGLMEEWLFQITNHWNHSNPWILIFKKIFVGGLFFSTLQTRIPRFIIYCFAWEQLLHTLTILATSISRPGFPSPVSMKSKKYDRYCTHTTYIRNLLITAGAEDLIARDFFNVSETRLGRIQPCLST